MLDAADRKTFLDAVRDSIARDACLDAADADGVAGALEVLFDHCSVEVGAWDDTGYSQTLLDLWVRFGQGVGVPAGSKGDYCTEAVAEAMRSTWKCVTLSGDYFVTEKVRDMVECEGDDSEMWMRVAKNAGILS